MSSSSTQPVAVPPPSPFRERAGQGAITPPLLGYPSFLHATRPIRSSPLAGPAFSSNPSITLTQSQSSAAISLDVPHSTPPSLISHSASLSASTPSLSSHPHRPSATLAGPSNSTGSIPTLNLDSRPSSPPSSILSHTGSSTSSFSSLPHSAYPRPLVAQAKSTSAVPTFSLFRRQSTKDPSPPPPSQPPFGHNRSASFAQRTVLPPPAHIPQAYNPRAPRPATTPGPSISRNPEDNWMSSSPFGCGTTPRFSRQSISHEPVVMPLSAREYRRQKCFSMSSNVAVPIKACFPSQGIDEERVDDLPHIIVSDSASSPSGNRPSSLRRATSLSLPSAASQESLRNGSLERQLSGRSSTNTFFSAASEHEVESTVITVVDPGVTPRRRQSIPNAAQRHSRLSLVDAVNRLSVASGDTEFFEISEEKSGIRPISVTEDDGVLRRASSRRNMPFRETALINTAAEEPIALQDRHRMARIAETCQVSSDKSLGQVLSSKFSDSSHGCQHKEGTEHNSSGDTFPDRAVPQSTADSSVSSPELQARTRRKLTKSRLQSVQAPSTRCGSPSPWIGALPFKASGKQNTPTTSTSDLTQVESVPQSLETGDLGKDNKRWTHRLTFQFIPSPSFHKRPKSTPSPPSLDRKPTNSNETRQRPSRAESGLLSSLTGTQGSATTITLMPPPPITSSSSVSSSAANSTSSLTGSSATMISRDTSATSIVAPSLAAVSRLEQTYPKIPSNLKESIVVDLDSDTESKAQQDEATTPSPVITPHDPEISCSLSSASSYVSFPSVSTPSSIPTALHAEHSDYLHPMWTVPMVTIITAPQTPGSPTPDEPPVRPLNVPAPCPAPISKVPSPRHHTARLKRPRPQTASSPAIFPTSSKSPHAQKTGFKSIFRSLINRAG